MDTMDNRDLCSNTIDSLDVPEFRTPESKRIIDTADSIIANNLCWFGFFLRGPIVRSMSEFFLLKTDFKDTVTIATSPVLLETPESYPLQ